MFERRIVQCQSFGKFEFLDIKRYVLVNKFTEESATQFRNDCEKILITGQDFLPILIDSYGGCAYALLGMIDFIQHCGVKVITICESKCMSCGSILFSFGQERYMSPLCTVMVHDVSSVIWGKETELTNHTKEVTRLNRLVYAALDKNTGQPSGYWRDLYKSNKYAELYMTAKAAKKHKLATIIGTPHLETVVSVKTVLKNGDKI